MDLINNKKFENLRNITVNSQYAYDSIKEELESSNITQERADFLEICLEELIAAAESSAEQYPE